MPAEHFTLRSADIFCLFSFFTPRYMPDACQLPENINLVSKSVLKPQKPSIINA